MISKITLLILVAVSSIVTSDKVDEGPLLSSFRGLHRDALLNADGTYQFSFSLPQQERQEQRDSDGKVTGYFAFVDNSGEEFSLHFDADDNGYQPQSDGLPQQPDETDDVQNAREDFLRYYEQTAKFLEALGSGESSESSSEEDGEYSDEDSSSEESEESSEEDEDEEEDEDDEGENKIFRGNFQTSPTRRVFRRIQQGENNLETSVFPQHTFIGRRS